jgi:hypothetical protein
LSLSANAVREILSSFRSSHSESGVTRSLRIMLMIGTKWIIHLAQGDVNRNR